MFILELSFDFLVLSSTIYNIEGEEMTNEMFKLTPIVQFLSLSGICVGGASQVVLWPSEARAPSEELRCER